MSMFARTARTTIQRNVRKFADMKDAPKVNFFPAEVSELSYLVAQRSMLCLVHPCSWL